MRGKIFKTAIFALLASILATTFTVGPAFAQGTTLAAPTVVDPTLTPGSSFSIDITVADVLGMLGYEFQLNYDPSVLMATGFDTYAPFVLAWPSSMGPGFVAMAYSYPIPELFGLDVPASPAFAVARVDFLVLDYGVSPLELTNSVVGNVFGGWYDHTVVNGVFSNIPQTGVTVVFNAYLLSSRKLPAGGMETATEQIENVGMWTTKATVRFVVVDLGGAVVAMAENTVVIMPGQVLRLSSDFDTTGWDLGDYRVRYTLEYLTFDGTAGVWALGAHGGLNGQTVKYKTFTVQ